MHNGEKARTYESGRITAQAEPSTRHTKGTMEVAQMIMLAIIRIDAPIGNQNLDTRQTAPRQYHHRDRGACVCVPLHNLGYLLEKVGALNLLHSRRPLDIVREQVGKDRLGHRDRKTAKEKEAVVVQTKLYDVSIGQCGRV